MSTVPPSQSGTTPSLYADCIWKTSLLPASIVSPTDGPKNKNNVSASVNGIVYSYTDPENQAKFIINVNNLMSVTFYGAVDGYYCVNSGVNSATVKPCRYVVMHDPLQSPPQGAHQLLVDADGNGTYIDTTWTDVNTQA